MPELAEIIRRIRFRLGLNMTEFGKLLGVSQGQMSRYESGRALPGYIPLGRLLHMAEGTEKNPVLDRLSELLGSEGRRLTAAEALRELDRMECFAEPLWNNLPPPPPRADTHIWDEFREFTPNVAELLKGVDEICTRRREVDPSLPLFIQLWLTNRDTDPAVWRCFSEAAKYLEFLLDNVAAQPSTQQSELLPGEQPIDAVVRKRHGTPIRRRPTDRYNP